eukprot:ANDGO_03679.mRNA.1 hypothetical protein
MVDDLAVDVNQMIAQAVEVQRAEYVGAIQEQLEYIQYLHGLLGYSPKETTADADADAGTDAGANAHTDTAQSSADRADSDVDKGSDSHSDAACGVVQNTDDDKKDEMVHEAAADTAPLAPQSQSQLADSTENSAANNPEMASSSDGNGSGDVSTEISTSSTTSDGDAEDADFDGSFSWMSGAAT